jgi:hypothetical protein
MERAEGLLGVVQDGYVIFDGNEAAYLYNVDVSYESTSSDSATSEKSTHRAGEIVVQLLNNGGKTVAAGPAHCRSVPT